MLRWLHRFKLWWRRGHRPVSSPRPLGDAPAVEADAGRAEETLGDVLSILGRESFALERMSPQDIRSRFEAWSQHVLRGSTPPDGAALPPGERHWDGVRRFVSNHRHEERHHVERSQRDLREALWSFVRSLGETLAAEQASDSQLESHLDRLKSSVHGQSTEEIKQAVLSVADSLFRVVAERRRRQDARLSSLSERMKGLRAELDEARRHLDTDPLTKLYNRKALDEQLERVVAVNVILSQTTCLAIVDLDHFKKVNDTYGHQAGDRVLIRVADALIETFPRKTDFVARYGGEEFAVLFQQDSLRIARALLDRMMQRLRQLRIEHEGRSIEVRASVGLAEWVPGEDPEDWLARADRAMYRAKRDGRDRVAEASPSECTEPASVTC
jgi:diguanylate cyclase (GGDEF)-like protein